MSSQSKEVPARGKGESPRFDIILNMTRGVRGRPKTYMIELPIPLVSASTDEDKVRICTRHTSSFSEEGWHQSLCEAADDLLVVARQVREYRPRGF